VNKAAEAVKQCEQQERRFQLVYDNPHLIALARGDLYLRKEDLERFRVPLGYFLFRVIPDWVAGMTAEPVAPSSTPPEAEPRETAPIPPPSPSVAVGPPPTDPGLRTTVVAVVTALAELGLIQVPGGAGKPPLPGDLHPAAAPSMVGNEVVGAWQPPPRPTLEGPRSAVRRAFYDMLSRG